MLVKGAKDGLKLGIIDGIFDGVNVGTIVVRTWLGQKVGNCVVGS